jgi:hypothetical protein
MIDLAIKEWTKLIRNRTFLLIIFILFGINIFSIMYCCKAIDPTVLKEKKAMQQDYVKTYHTFIEEMPQRAALSLEARQDTMTPYYKKDIDKTVAAYKGFTNVVISNQYPYGATAYSGYGYGIYFVLIFSFVSLYAVFLSEKKKGLLAMLQTTKRGRKELILTKLQIYFICVIVFTFLQEIMTALFYQFFYGLGDLSCSIQSLSVLRNCAYRLSIGEGIAVIIVFRIMFAVTVSAVIFFFGVCFMYPLIRIGGPVVLVACQFLCFDRITVDSYLDYLKCLNIFYAWDMQSVLGVYHNLNIAGEPFEVNRVLLVIAVCTILLITFVLPARFEHFQPNGNTHIFHLPMRNISMGVLLFRKESLFLNECYKLLVFQKKWIVVLAFIIMLIFANDIHIDNNVYSTAREASYHMYLSKLKGANDSKAKQYLKKEEDYMASLMEQMRIAKEKNDENSYSVAEAEYLSREEGMNTILQQQEFVERAKGHGYWIDEILLQKILCRYDQDILLIGLSFISFLVLLSGIYACVREWNIISLTTSTRKGRSPIQKAKLSLSVLLLFTYGISMNIPLGIALKEIFKDGNWNLQFQYLTTPCNSSTITILEFFLLVVFIRFFLLALCGGCTILFARKSRNEFYTSVLFSGIVLVVCVILYIFKLNIARILLQAIGGSYPVSL